MPGNSGRRGAVRKPGSKKGAIVGSGGQGRKALRGRGPTPKAEDRVYHAAHQRKLAAEAKSAKERPARRRRDPDAPEVVVGRNSVLEALRAGIPATTLHLASWLDSDERVREILALATDQNVRLREVGRSELDDLADGAVHQGVALTVPDYAYRDLDDLLDAAAEAGVPPLVVALDQVTDPRNLGAVIRSAGAFGAHGVVVTTRRSAGVTAAAWKVSAGALARVPVARVPNLARGLAQLRRAGVFVVGLDGAGDASVRDLPFASDPLCLVIGSEGKGLSRLVREQCDAVAAIEIATSAESLNASVAAGIALFAAASAR
ncbi:MAG: 23S rRNA (guanosine(2251)-2'-O)-methyltransferase RlmB [Micrococcales bacterium]|nr:23S rRNA (guanosine(2251)-2'-O)-methyltransferase RlmB [Micrococcales bacterium]MCL2668940.1 23S rRNA (guanosine(2251)-2'-O)-methyltransferase RlmB [Micrococcales bacterium]